MTTDVRFINVDEVMRKPLCSNSIFITNYEDYDIVSSAERISFHWPQLWEGELRAEIGLYEESVRMREYIHNILQNKVSLSDLVERAKKHKPNEENKEQYQKLVSCVLLGIASDEVIAEMDDGRKIYRVK